MRCDRRELFFSSEVVDLRLGSLYSSPRKCLFFSSEVEEFAPLSAGSSQPKYSDFVRT